MNRALRNFLTLFATTLASCAADEAPPTIEAPTWEAYLASSTRHFEGATIYVIDGDIPVTLDELSLAYERLATEIERHNAGVEDGAFGSAIRPSTVNRINGQDDVLSPNVASSLTYCVSDSFGALKQRVVSEMAQATANWEMYANVNFIYNPAQDFNCTGSNVNVVFAVRPWISDFACSFFPSGPICESRTLLINYPDIDSHIAYGDVTTLGVLRHELGHILGLRHEHIRLPGTCTEDSNWRALTSYDSASVMHLPWCQGSTNTGDLIITALDAAGIALLYPTVPPPPPFTVTAGAPGVVTTKGTNSLNGSPSHPASGWLWERSDDGGATWSTWSNQQNSAFVAYAGCYTIEWRVTAQRISDGSSATDYATTVVAIGSGCEWEPL